MDPQATKPSKRWQPEKVTSTTGLQHEHLVPLDATSQCKRIKIIHSLIDSQSSKHKWVGGFSNQAHTKATHPQGAQPQPRLATTSVYNPMVKYSRYPFTRRFSQWLDAPIDMTGRVALSPVTRGRPCVALDSTATARSSNGHHAPTVTKRPDALLNWPDA
jgi:hypothetical protein